MSIKFLVLGGGVFWVLGGGEGRFYFYGRGDFSEIHIPPCWRVPRMAAPGGFPSEFRAKSEFRANSEQASQTLYFLVILCNESPWLPDSKEHINPWGETSELIFGKGMRTAMNGPNLFTEVPPL